MAASISVAKLASRRAKPDGVVVVPPEEITSFLHPLDVGELYGVGEKTQAMLHRLGLVTVGDVAHTPLRTLQRAVGDGLGSHCSTTWPGGATPARSTPDGSALGMEATPTSRWAPRRPSAATSTTAR